MSTPTRAPVPAAEKSPRLGDILVLPLVAAAVLALFTRVFHWVHGIVNPIEVTVET